MEPKLWQHNLFLANVNLLPCYYFSPCASLILWTSSSFFKSTFWPHYLYIYIYIYVSLVLVLHRLMDK